MGNKHSDTSTISDTTMKQKRIEYDKLTFFYMSLPYMLLGHILGALLLSALMFGSVDTYSIGIWLLLNILVTFYRYYHYRLFRQTDEDEKLEHSSLWLDRYYTDVLVNGIIWGASAFLLFPETGFMDQSIVLLFLITIGFSSMGLLASKRELLLTYVLVVFIPVILRLFFMEDLVYNTMAYAGLGLVLLMILAANYYGNIINTSLLTHRDYITTRHSYLQLKEKFFSIFEHAPVGIYHFNHHLNLEETNQTFAGMVGEKDRKTLIGRPLGNLFDDPTLLKLHERVIQGSYEEYEGILHTYTNPDDQHHVRLSSVPMHEDDNEIVGGVTIIKDLTPETRANEALEHFRSHHPLTGLPNRDLLLEHLKTTLEEKLRNDSTGALLFLDVDHFKNINRSYGQKVGDAILLKIAEKLQASIPESSTIAHIGGDAFAILIPELRSDKAMHKKAVFAFIANLRRAFEKVLVVGDLNYHISFSVGVALFKSNILSPLDILKQAETAMFEAKNSARGTVRFYERGYESSILNDLSIANEIYKAIKHDELTMYYQPQQNLKSGRLTGAEALVRWNHPRKGPISPAHFIPIAEESGAIIELEEWIFDHVFQDIRIMVDAFAEFQLNYIAVNVSSIHFLQPNFVQKITDLVRKHRINPVWINFEITESGIMHNIDEAIERIKELKKMGFGFSIDDFGTGYSSLTYLKKLPVDTIKIDRSFVKDADRNEEDRLIVESVIAISQKFGFDVLAEGIDRQETLDYFKSTDCKTFQGYLFYKPISMQEFIHLI